MDAMVHNVSRFRVPEEFEYKSQDYPRRKHRVTGDWYILSALLTVAGSLVYNRKSQVPCAQQQGLICTVIDPECPGSFNRLVMFNLKYHFRMTVGFLYLCM